MRTKKLHPDIRTRIRLHRDMVSAVAQAARHHGLSVCAEVNYVLRHHYYKIKPTAASLKIERSYNLK